MVELAHEADAHGVPDGYPHSPLAPQIARHGPVPGMVAHTPRGSVPAAACVQLPTAPIALHRLQAPVHAVLQQTPSTQNPDWQSALQPQVLPFAVRMPPFWAQT